MNKLYAGKSIKVNLPREYQHVEYLESTGTQYINTGIYIDSYVNLEVDCECEPGNTREIIAGYEASNLIGLAIDFNNDGYVSKILNFQLGNGYSYISNTAATRHNIRLDTNSLKVYVDDESKSSSSTSPAYSRYSNSNAWIGLFAGYNGYYNSILYSNSKIYHAKIEQYQNGIYVLVRDLYPCYRKSDNVAGMYDIINNVFYTNDGTGSFITGNEIYAVAPKINSIYIGVSAESPLLPYNYQQIEYVEGDGTSPNYIPLTGAIPTILTSDSILTIDFQLTSTSVSGARYFAGATHDSNNRCGIGINASGKLLLGIGKGYHSESADTYRHIAVIDNPNKKASLDGVNKTASSGTYSTPTTFSITSLLGGFNTDNELLFTPVKIYNFKIEENDVLVHDFYPCYRKSDNRVGVYDIITDVFYASPSGSSVSGGNPTSPMGESVARKIKRIYIGDSQNKAKLIWEQSWRADYQQVEYIQGTGVQYINCGYIINETSKLTADIQFTSTSSSISGYVTGGSNGTENRFGVAISSSSNFNFCLGKGYHYRSANTNRQTIIIDSTTKKITQNGTNRNANTGSYSACTNATWFGILGGLNQSGNLGCAKAKFYHAVLENGSTGVVEHDYYPVVRKNDNMAGVFDIITKTFYGNVGDGYIIAGSNYEYEL